MKILAVADEENDVLWNYFKPKMVKDIDLVVSCGDLDVLCPAGSVDLRDDDGGAGGDRDKETDQQGNDLGRAASDGGQRDGSDKAADNHAVHGVIQLLYAGTRRNRQKKDQQLLPDNTGCQVTGR